MDSKFKTTRIAALLSQTERSLKSEDLVAYKNVRRARMLLAGISKKELRDWLKMTPADAKKLSNKELYAILSKVIPEMDELSRRVEDLSYIFGLVKDNRIVPLAKRYKAKVLQLREVLVGVIMNQRTDMHAVVEALEKKYPKLRKDIAKIKAKQTKIYSSVVKTTTDKLESGAARGFPKDPPKEILSSRVEDLVRTAGLFSSLQILLRRIKGGIESVWELVKEKVGDIIDSMLSDVSSTIGTMDSLTQELEGLL